MPCRFYGMIGFWSQKEHRSGAKQGIRALLFGTALLLAAAGCAAPEESGTEVLVTEQETGEEYDGAVAASVTDVELHLKVLCQYESADYEDLSFDVERQEIESVFVKEGERVEKGQLLVSLVSSDSSDQLRQLQYELDRLKLQQKAVMDEMEADITEAIFEIAVAEGQSVSQMEQREREKEEAIRESYRHTLEDLEDRITFAEQRLNRAKRGEEDHQIYAGISGIVTYVRTGLEGSKTQIGKTVITIMDPTNMYFIADKPEQAAYFTEGEAVDLEITTGLSAGTYSVLPKLTENAEGEPQLIFLLQGEDAAAGSSINKGTRASITLEIGRREHVLAVPLRALHKAGDKCYVYVVNELGHRITRFVEIGLEGDNYVEILSGLEEGEYVSIG